MAVESCIMRFCYLRIALLTSAIAATAVTDTAETDVELTASRQTSSPTFVRSELAASAVTGTQNVDDEDRGGMPIPKFAELMGLNPKMNILNGIKRRVFETVMKERLTLKQIYEKFDLSNPKRVFLSDVRWIDWIYVLCQLSRFFKDNEYEFIIAVMSITYGPEALADHLLSAVKFKNFKPFAINLINVSNDEVKSRVFEILPQLERELPDPKPPPTDNGVEALRARIEAYHEQYFTANQSKIKLPILTNYLGAVFSKDRAVGTGQIGGHKYYEDAALLKFLLNMDKTSDQDYIRSLASLYLEMNVPPSKIVSMLVQNESRDDQFIILFSTKSSKSFWLHYLEQYNKRYHSRTPTSTEIFDFEQLLETLNDIAMNTNLPKSAFRQPAISTWLKVLTSPRLAHLDKSQRICNNLMLIWRNKGVLPSSIVSALMFDEAEDKHFTILFLEETSKTFWVRYFEQYIQESFNDVKLMRSANFDLGRLLKTLFAVANQDLHSAYKYAAYGTILKLLISPYSAHLSSSHELVIELTSNLLLERTLPSEILHMLMYGEADADIFNILFVNKSSKTFWVRYLKSYFEFSSDAKDFASTDFQQLLIMLHTVGAREVARTDQFLVSSILLKILISPEITSIVDPRYLNEMVSSWLHQKVPPSDIVSMLVLEEVVADYLPILFGKTPTSNFWEDYTKAFYADPPSHQDHMMSTLRRAFGDADTKRILEAALTVEATREKAKALIF